jgi:hypothetical protein
MRRWYVPLAVLGLGGIGLLVLTDRGRRSLRWAMERMDSAPDTLAEWNDAAQRELERIQTALNRVATSLEAVR